ncbi:glutathione S-transferase family protein [Pseudomonas sp. URMO17WK12:I2]|uniref:glutathione S-transferase family protein n=1 Tax=Pseudomonas sp. URMO17WK12:I2 TaxID=1261623 RepID=UPI000DAECAE8|nr:glutathione S-transferase [Pseudomonas sp. URMO17WK12:I2]PZW40322.1 glutathione S-transferase [Pseudomonas sp. URMO17WK12:I2]
MLKIWGRKNSSNVRKALWCAEEAGIAYERVEAGGAFGVVNEPEYLARNPNGRVPMIEDGDLVLWESNAIVRYLAAAYAPGSLYPEDPASRACGDKWMDWTTSSFASEFRDLFWGILRTPVEQRNLPVIEAARQRCIALLELPERALGERPYLSGDSFAMGDIPLGSFIYAWFEMPIERPPQPNLQAWYARLCERPAYQRAVMTELT